MLVIAVTLATKFLPNIQLITYLTSLKQQLGGLMNVRRITTKKGTIQNKLPETGIAKQKLLIEPALHLSHATQATSNRYNQSHHGKDAL